MSISAVETALQTVDKIADVINRTSDVTNYFTTKSLSDVTKLTRVEPLTILSKDCLNLEYAQDVNQSLLNIFSAYYLQAVSILTKVNNVEVVRILDSLNPDRDETGFLMSERVSRESIDTLVLENYKFDLPKSTSVALEFDREDVTKQALHNVSNLSVGKLLNVDIAVNPKDVNGTETGERIIKLPISVRLMVSVIPNESIAHLLTFKSEDMGLIERYHAWRAGRISFIKDLIFCQDIIDEYKKAMMKDNTGTMQEIMRRANNTKKFGLLTKNPSLVSASNLFVVTEQVAREMEQRLKGKLSNPKVREKAFDNTYAMIIAVIDREWERVTFYTRGINSSTDLSIKEIKEISKSKGPDVMDMMKSMQMGMSPTF